MHIDQIDTNQRQQSATRFLFTCKWNLRLEFICQLPALEGILQVTNPKKMSFIVAPTLTCNPIWICN